MFVNFNANSQQNPYNLRAQKNVRFGANFQNAINLNREIRAADTNSWLYKNGSVAACMIMFVGGIILFSTTIFSADFIRKKHQASRENANPFSPSEQALPTKLANIPHPSVPKAARTATHIR